MQLVSKNAWKLWYVDINANCYVQILVTKKDVMSTKILQFQNVVILFKLNVVKLQLMELCALKSVKLFNLVDTNAMGLVVGVLKEPFINLVIKNVQEYWDVVMSAIETVVNHAIDATNHVLINAV